MDSIVTKMIKEEEETLARKQVLERFQRRRAVSGNQATDLVLGQLQSQIKMSEDFLKFLKEIEHE